MLGHHGRGAAGLVRHHDSALLGNRQVDHVRADGAGGDHFERGQAAHFLAPRDDPARVDDDLGPLGPGDLLARALRRILKQGDVPVGREPLQMRRTGDLSGIVAGHYDLYAFWHGISSFGSVYFGSL